MERVSGKRLQIIMLMMLLLPLTILAVSFFFNIKTTSSQNLKEQLYRFNENTALDSINIPVLDVNRTLKNMAEILSDPERIENFISPDTDEFNKKIAAIMNSYSYLDDVIVVSDKSAAYKTYPENIRFDEGFNPKLRPWYHLTQ
ncbi:hypothetical protein [Kluyvera sp. 142486]|uniref:hypothetical protein n=1 Tax=Kluyvera sp. 142486 TaxID=3390050 RepID=UPI0039804462